MTNTYSERQRIEKQYHDDKYREYAEAATAERVSTPHRRLWELAGEPHNLTILDFGCGDGWLSVHLAKLGNTVYGFDISEVLVERAKQFAKTSNVSEKTCFTEMAAENLDFPNESFDMIIGSSILHHTDLEVTLGRIKQVLKADGMAIFLEPLNQNVALRIWRLLTPWRRSKTERALTEEDLASIRTFFPSSRFTYYCLASMFTEGLLLLRPKSRIGGFMNDWFERLDERLLRALPELSRFSAVVIMEMRK